MAGYDDDANARTTLERAHLILKREDDKNGELAMRHGHLGRGARAEDVTTSPAA